MSRIKLSVIIVAYNNLELLTKCLDSIYRYNDAVENTEIIIVDQSPNDKVYNYINDTYNWVRIYKHDNKGFGSGNNFGVEHSTGEYLLFLNPDTVLIEPIFEFAIEKFAREPKLAIFGVKLLNRNSSDTFSYFWIDRFGIVAAVTQVVANRLNYFNSRKMFIHGADFFIRRDLFLKAGMFDEKIFMYDEEPDLTKRVFMVDNSLYSKFFKEKRILHYEGGSSPGLSGQLNTVVRYMKTEKYYCEKYRLNFNKRLKNKIRYMKFSLLVTRIRNLDQYAIKKEVLNEYKKYLQ